MKTIFDYCPKEIEGWHSLPESLNVAKQGKEHLTCSFLRPDGVHLIVSIKDYGCVQTLHVSLGPVNSISILTPQELDQFIFEQAAQILNLFFGERKFAMQPADPNHPEVYQYFSLLEDYK